MKKRRILLLAVCTVLALTSCGKKESGNDTAKTELAETAPVVVQQAPTQTVAEKAEEVQAKTASVSADALKVIASPGAHTEILEQAAKLLAAEGIELYIESGYDDYMMPNWFVDGGVFDCNYFQHEAYLNSFNEEQNTDLVSAGRIHFEPLGVYPANKYRLSDVADGDTIAIPVDTANQARALKLLSDIGFITLREGVDALSASVSDIAENPHNLKLELMDASQIPSAIAESDYIVMNGNYARQVLYTVTADALVYENPAASVAARYANVIAVKNGMQDDARVKRLVEVLQSSQIRSFIDNSYAGTLIPYSG